MICCHCGRSEDLTARFGILICEPCRAERQRHCRDCKRCAPDVTFAHGRSRCCVQCAKARRGKPKRTKSGKQVARDPRLNLSHRDFVRNQPCLVGSGCRGLHIHAHHVRQTAPDYAKAGGMGLLPDDRFTVPLCNFHHIEGHTKGWKTFETKYNIVLLDQARILAALSPYLLDETSE